MEPAEQMQRAIEGRTITSRVTSKCPKLKLGHPPYCTTHHQRTKAREALSLQKPSIRQAWHGMTSGAGITSSSSGGCTTKSNPRCTSYDGLLSGTVDGAITLKGACGCTLVITGGTETGHAGGTYSHGNGYKLDFRKNTALNNYITSRFERIGNRGDGYPQWRAASGNIYCDEGDHWDVLYY
ncbi:hypothetical protein CBER1_04653 [Cercospora berteroae]|uniref:Uncharacterized protein n=1 Tax=Cercospora berteroae TaxID=357750 RepID=A0A2S6BR23_9PEZI|nr:hypothetical protein CBER1_04653 [Cercospora berteroae]